MKAVETAAMAEGVELPQRIITIMDSPAPERYQFAVYRAVIADRDPSLITVDEKKHLNYQWHIPGCIRELIADAQVLAFRLRPLACGQRSEWRLVNPITLAEGDTPIRASFAT